MSAFQTCRDTSDAVPFYLPQQLYLKPAAKMTISIKLPDVKKTGKSISNWEIMEKLRTSIKPDEFTILKVTTYTAELVQFEAEIDNKTKLNKVLSKLDGKSMKLKELPEFVRVKANEAKSDFPTHQHWEDFFQQARDMDEMKAGQRPDTVHLSNLPIKWFIPYHLRDDEDVTPSERMLYKIFEKFGPIRYVDVPICDPYRKQMRDHISGIKSHSFDNKEYFEGYVQFKDYIGFTKTMDALKGMKLLKKEEDETVCVDIKVDFDKTRHLSDASIRRREILRDRLAKKQLEKEKIDKEEINVKKKLEQNERQKQIDIKAEKERRRKEREEKRKTRILAKLKLNDCDELNDKINREEKKLLKAQRKLESIRLLEDLFRRIKDKKGGLDLTIKCKAHGNDELKNLKSTTELAVLVQRQKLHNAIKGRVVLKSILSDKKQPNSESSSDLESSSSSKSEHHEPGKPSSEGIKISPPWYPNWYGFPCPPLSQTIVHPSPNDGYNNFPPAGRNLRAQNASRSYRGRPYYRTRGFKSGYRAGYRKNWNPPNYPSEIEEEYVKYFSKFLGEHDDRWRKSSRSRSPPPRSRTRSRSRHRSRSRRRSRSRHRSYSRSYSRSRSRRRSRSSRRRSRSESRRSRSKSVTSSRSDRRRRTRSKSSPRRGKSSKSRESCSRTPDRKK